MATPLAAHQSCSSLEHPQRRARVGERRRTDLDRGRAREQQLDRVGSGRHTADADDRERRAARRGRRARRAPRRDGSRARSVRRHPRPIRAGSCRVAGSIAMPSNVFVTVTAAAPAACARRAIDTMSVTCAVSFAHTGRSLRGDDRRDRVRRVVGIVREQMRAAVEVRTAQVDLDRDDVGRRARELPRGLLDTPRPSVPRCSPRRAPAPAAARAGRRASHASTPGPCRPTLLSMPAPASCSRGAGLPAHGSAASDFTTTAPRRASGKYASSSAPCPLVPDAVMIGFGSSTSPTRVLASTHGGIAHVSTPERRERLTGRAPAGRWRRGGTPAATGRGARGGPSRRCLRPRRCRRRRS